MTTISLLASFFIEKGIICSKNVADILSKYTPILKMYIINFEKYIKDFNVYYIG